MTLALAMQVSGALATAAGAHHGAGGSLLDRLATGLAIGVVALVSVLCVVYFVRPGEASGHHIKRRVLE